jgi:hypothetical protein
MGDVAKRPVVRDWTVARSLEEMDDNGIGTAVLSLSPPGLHHLGLEQVRRRSTGLTDTVFVGGKWLMAPQAATGPR